MKVESKRIFIIAGEASGDEHAAKLISELKTTTAKPIEFAGIGGRQMANAGANILYNLAKFGVTGFTEVIKQFSHIRKAYKLAQNYIQQNKIDLLILVDYPGFNLRFAKFAKKHNLKILYYISPQIWAWKAKRIHTIKKYVDVMAVILPFEKELYDKENIPAYFVGNPLTQTTKLEQTPTQLKKHYNLLGPKKIIGILPGSRNNEIKQLLPTMLEACNKLNKAHPELLRFVLPVASSLDKNLLQEHLNNYNFDLTIITEDNCGVKVMACCDSLMVASGTASLQAALLHKPMVIIYRASTFTYFIARLVIQCAYLGLANLLANKMIVPELLQHNLTSENLFFEMNRFVIEKPYTHNLVQDLKKINKMLDNKSVDCRLAQLVFDMINSKQISMKDTSKSNENSQFEVKNTSVPYATPVESCSVTSPSKLGK